MIHETNDQFPFDKMTLCKPISISGGNFFIRYALNEQALYIQPPKCYIKQITAKSSKKPYCDLVFQQENEAFIRWMETLENKTQHILYDHRAEWFQTTLEKEDIEQSFNSPMKIYKSGKEYIVRTNIPSRGGKPILKIYDEDERDIPLESITENTKVMVILEIQGVRSSSSSFQIDIEMKQMMILKPEEIFNTCIFKKTNRVEVQRQEVPLRLVEDESPQKIEDEVPQKVEDESPQKVEDEVPQKVEEMIHQNVEPESLGNAISISTEETDLCEVDFDLEEMNDTDMVCIKERKDMYYKMYEEARQKAKVARDLALSAYLEANRIKNKYMLDDVLDSSSDESLDIDEDDE
jgi:hypothetical protein